MNTLIQINNYFVHAPAGVVAMVFAIILGYVLKVVSFFPNRFIPAVVIPVTAVLYSLIQFCADIASGNQNAGLMLLFNFMLGFIYGGIAWLLHAQLLRRFLDPRIFNDDGSIKFPSNNQQPPSQP